MRKHISAVAIALALSAGSALAADLPSRKEAPVYVPPPPPPLWTGFYAGLNAGYGWGATSNAGTVSLPLLDGVAAQANALDPLRQLPGTGLINGSTALANSGIANVNQNGFIGGGQIGYNYQWSPNFVVGLEADFQGSTIQGSGNYAGASQDSISWKDPFIPGLSPCVTNGCTLTRSAVGIGQVNAGVDWMGTVRGRVGYLVTPTTLVYATGGLAYGEADLNATWFSPLLSPVLYQGGSWLGTTDLRTGWTAGAGVEWMFLPRWSVKAEYLYYDLGTANTANFGPVFYTSKGTNLLSTAGYSAPFNGNVVRLGVNYHFNGGGPAPIVAKY